MATLMFCKLGALQSSTTETSYSCLRSNAVQCALKKQALQPMESLATGNRGVLVVLTVHIVLQPAIDHMVTVIVSTVANNNSMTNKYITWIV